MEENDIRIRRYIKACILVSLACIVLVLFGDGLRKLWLAGSQPPGTFSQAWLREIAFHRLTWAGIAGVAVGLVALERFPFATVLITILGLELLSVGVLHEHLLGAKFSPPSVAVRGRFVPHPLLQGVPNPGAYGQVSHSANGHRTTVNVGKHDDAIKIVALGGSSTYDIAVADENTWPSVLSSRLGPGFTVENLGVPGYSSVEHIIQAAFDLRGERRPKCAIAYLGWNDLRNNGIEGTKADYSNFHLPSQRANLGLVQSESLPVRRSAFVSILSTISTADYRLAKPPGRADGKYDRRLSAIYRENVGLILLLLNHYKIKAIVVPQILNYEKAKGSNVYGWLPYVRNGDIQRLMNDMNEDLMEVAKRAGVSVIDDILSTVWKDEDFSDIGHFAPRGSEKFANTIATQVAQICK